MPFTPSHAIVAWPLARTRVPLAAVMIGAMAPDVPLFVPFEPAIEPGYALTHGIPSLVWTTLPIAAILLLIWMLVLRPHPRARALRTTWWIGMGACLALGAAVGASRVPEPALEHVAFAGGTTAGFAILVWTLLVAAVTRWR